LGWLDYFSDNQPGVDIFFCLGCCDVVEVFWGNMIAIKKLRVGDVVQNLGSGNAYRVSRITEDGRVFAVREVEVSNPGEWVKVKIPPKAVDSGTNQETW
jgi:hypothetical protein